MRGYEGSGRVLLAVGGVALAALAPQSANAADDADVWAHIDSLRPVAEAIAVDGDPSDWGPIPAFADPAGDSGGDASRDITSVRVAPTADALYVLIETAGVPAAAGNPFWIQLDSLGLAFADVEIALDPVGPDGLSCGSRRAAAPASAPPRDSSSATRSRGRSRSGWVTRWARAS